MAENCRRLVIAAPDGRAYSRPSLPVAEIPLQAQPRVWG